VIRSEERAKPEVVGRSRHSQLVVVACSLLRLSKDAQLHTRILSRSRRIDLGENTHSDRENGHFHQDQLHVGWTVWRDNTEDPQRNNGHSRLEGSGTGKETACQFLLSQKPLESEDAANARGGEAR
jgi:hypothetical protein